MTVNLSIPVDAPPSVDLEKLRRDLTEYAKTLVRHAPRKRKNATHESAKNVSAQLRNIQDMCKDLQFSEAEIVSDDRLKYILSK